MNKADTMDAPEQRKSLMLSIEKLRNTRDLLYKLSVLSDNMVRQFNRQGDRPGLEDDSLPIQDNVEPNIIDMINDINASYECLIDFIQENINTMIHHIG